TLLEQKNAGSNRIPLIAALIESGKIKKEDAFKGLETLIEMTIVEVLTWTEGTFELDVDTTVVSDEYRYIPEKLKLDLHLNTQNVLMDALRIYDEKKRDGTLMDETFPNEEAAPPPSPSIENESQLISIDDLGLDVLDDLEKVIPGFFTPVKVNDPTVIHRDKIGRQLAELPPGDQERLLAFLVALGETTAENGVQETSPHAVILFSRSEYISHIVITACKHDGLFTFSTDEEENLDHIINQSISKALLPVLVIDPPANILDAAAEEEIGNLIRRVQEKYPAVAIFQLAPPECYDLALNAMKSGVRAVLPKPDLLNRKTTFVQDTITFLDTLKQAVKIPQPAAGGVDTFHFKECMDALVGLKELGDITAVLDRFAAGMLERAVTFTVRKTELVAERLHAPDGVRPISVTMVTGSIPLLLKAVSEGVPYYGPQEDMALAEKLYPVIEPPAARQALLLPLKCLGRVLAVTYADFGNKSPSPVQLELAEILARHAGLVYENSLYRKKFEQMIQQQH
ncbi:MAG TPA: DUF4388 domain-containing protein, partial [Geobacteraceae bacterium]|nr:DUF4388 domain-containing protein [Geobacteraceae bacterium]